MEILTRTATERTLIQIGNAYWELYPAKAKYFKRALQELRKVQKSPDGGWMDSKGRRTFVRFRIPTELYLFVERHLPGFFRERKNIDVLIRVWGDLVKAGVSRQKKTTIAREQPKEARERRRPESVDGDDHPKLPARTPEASGESRGVSRAG